MRLVLKDGTVLELAKGNDQSKFVVSYESDDEVEELEALLTENNLSDAYYEINGTVTDTIKNKVLSGTHKDTIQHTVTYYLTDAKTAEMETLQVKVAQQDEFIADLSDTIDTLLILALEPTPTESEVESDV